MHLQNNSNNYTVEGTNFLSLFYLKKLDVFIFGIEHVTLDPDLT